MEKKKRSFKGRAFGKVKDLMDKYLRLFGDDEKNDEWITPEGVAEIEGYFIDAIVRYVRENEFYIDNKYKVYQTDFEKEVMAWRDGQYRFFCTGGVLFKVLASVKEEEEKEDGTVIYTVTVDNVTVTDVTTEISFAGFPNISSNYSISEIIYLNTDYIAKEALNILKEDEFIFED